MELQVGDILRLRKPHACGSYRWEVVRVGTYISIKCLKCGHRVVLERKALEKRVKAVHKSGAEEPASDFTRPAAPPDHL